MPLVVVLLPALAAPFALLLPRDAWRRALLIVTAAAHTAVTGSWWFERPGPVFQGWFGVDALGLLVLSIASGLFLVAAVYGAGYLAREGHGARDDIFQRGHPFTNEPEAVFVATLLLFLASMSLVAVSRHFGLIWVAVEVTTLSSAPLIYFHRHHRSLEATWKYLLICSVGIAVALLGTFFLAAAAAANAVELPTLVDDYVASASLLDATWLKAAFIAFLVGYGTKVGLAPMHSWLPDAHSEAPSVVSALLSGALLNTAFLGILRLFQVMVAAGMGDDARDLLILFGAMSMAVAAAFIVAQKDYKRMLAYSSVEHMGIIAIGVGVGGTAPYGAMLHMVNHSVAKAMLFLVAGNILAVYRTKTITEVSGLLRVAPVTGALWIGGFLAITGTPPAGVFLSEFTILRGMADSGQWLVAGAYLALLGIIFVAMAAAFLRMAQGPATHARTKETLVVIGPPAFLAVIALAAGLYLPGELMDVAREAASTMGGT